MGLELSKVLETGLRSFFVTQFWLQSQNNYVYFIWWVIKSINWSGYTFKETPLAPLYCVWVVVLFSHFHSHYTFNTITGSHDASVIGYPCHLTLIGLKFEYSLIIQFFILLFSNWIKMINELNSDFIIQNWCCKGQRCWLHLLIKLEIAINTTGSRWLWSELIYLSHCQKHYKSSDH